MAKAMQGQVAASQDEAAASGRVAAVGAEASGLSISSQASTGSLAAFTIDPPSSLGSTHWDAEEMAGLDADGLPFDRQVHAYLLRPI